MTDSIKCMTLNPKCVSLEKLYGQFDKDSYEWSDGILATIIRRFAKVTKDILFQTFLAVTWTSVVFIIDSTYNNLSLGDSPLYCGRVQESLH